jgi:hypothetical protein
MDCEIFEPRRDGPHGVFVLKTERFLSSDFKLQMLYAWDKAWQRADLRPPPLLILDEGLTLEALGDAALRDAGLMHLPGHDPEVTF